MFSSPLFLSASSLYAVMEASGLGGVQDANVLSLLRGATLAAARQVTGRCRRVCESGLPLIDGRECGLIGGLRCRSKTKLRGGKEECAESGPGSPSKVAEGRRGMGMRAEPCSSSSLSPFPAARCW